MGLCRFCLRLLSSQEFEACFAGFFLVERAREFASPGRDLAFLLPNLALELLDGSLKV